MFWFSQISLNRLTHSSAICFTSFFLLTVQEMHSITQSLSRLHSPRRQAPGTKRVIPPFGQEHARQQYKPSANLQISWSHWVTLPHSQPYSSLPSLSQCRAAGWLVFGPALLPGQGQPPVHSSHHGQACPSLISHVLALWPPSSWSPPMRHVSPSHCSPMALLERDATIHWQLRVKDDAMMCQNQILIN